MQTSTPKKRNVEIKKLLRNAEKSAKTIGYVKQVMLVLGILNLKCVKTKCWSRIDVSESEYKFQNGYHKNWSSRISFILLDLPQVHWRHLRRLQQQHLLHCLRSRRPKLQSRLTRRHRIPFRHEVRPIWRGLATNFTHLFDNLHLLRRREFEILLRECRRRVLVSLYAECFLFRYFSRDRYCRIFA